MWQLDQITYSSTENSEEEKWIVLHSKELIGNSGGKRYHNKDALAQPLVGGFNYNVTHLDRSFTI